VNADIPEGSPVSPIQFTVYLSGLFRFVEEMVPSVKALSFIDDVVWMVEGDGEDELSETLERAATAAQEWADASAVTFDAQKMETILLSRLRKSRNPAAAPRGIQVAGHTVQFNKQATRWLGVWLESQLTLKENHESTTPGSSYGDSRGR